jgi:phosphoribosylamine--glycine ligase
LKNDLLELFTATATQQLQGVTIEYDKRVAGTIMAVSGGYPGSYEKGFAIRGLDVPEGADSMVFHAGTKMENGKVFTDGGRVLCVTSFANTIYEAVDKSREVLQHLDFEGMYFRRDIGYEFK